MNAFQSLAKVLARRSTDVRLFFRDDDGGWADDRLHSLAGDFAQQNLPLDIAVIPGALSEQSIAMINDILDADGSKVSVHQHGFTHANHQIAGRSCEFGSDRNQEQQYRDIAAGQQTLSDVFGKRVKPVFTPPWNRCTSDTAMALQSLGFKYLSRITGSDLIDSPVTELPVAIDWLKKRKGVCFTTAEMVEYINSVFETDSDVIGVMLHHEHMDADNRALLRQFVEVLRESRRVSFHSMMDIANAQVQAG